MNASIADWGVEVSFCRARVGGEFELVSKIRKTTDASGVRFFGTYGYFDLVALRTFCDLSAPDFIPIDRDILELAPFRFFAPGKESSPEVLLRSLSRWPAAVLSFLKIHPSVLEVDPVGVPWELASLLTGCFEDAHVFLGLGFSEFLLLAGGDDLQKLLWTVTQSRIPVEHDRFGGFLRRLGIKGTTSLFLKTTTLPLTSYDNVHAHGEYHKLKGVLHPVVTVSCDPACEPRVMSLLPSEVKVRTVYGKTDLILYWQDAIPISQFAHFLTELRSSPNTAGLVTKTTSYLEIERDKKDGDGSAERTTCAPAQIAVDDLTMSRFREVKPPALRASLADLMLRLLSCVGDSRKNSVYRDMANTIEYVTDIVDRVLVPEETPPLEKMRARFVLARVADLARAAINQRYAGLESHPETLAHSHSPSTCDIGRIVNAATCVPYYIFSHLRSGVTAEKTWPGFVVFGGAYSPHWHPQDILALPADSLYSPIRQWWKLTHEAAHAVFRLLNVKGRLLAYSEGLYRALTDDIDRSNQSPEHVINELFANWFDWHYIFGRESDIYQKHIWNSWLDYPITWGSPRQYIYRSFAVYLCGDIEAWSEERNKGRRDRYLWPYLTGRWGQFVALLNNDARWVKLLQDAGVGVEEDVFRVMEYVQPLMRFFSLRFEEVCGVEGLWSRLNPPYEGVAEDVRVLSEGRVIGNAIVNPCRLNLELQRLYADRAIPLGTEVAYVFSMANTYLQLSGREGG